MTLVDRSLAVSHHLDFSVYAATVDILSASRFSRVETIAIAIFIRLIFPISELVATSDQQVP